MILMISLGHQKGVRRHQSKANLMQDPPVAENLLNTPVYQPIKAYKSSLGS